MLAENSPYVETGIKIEYKDSTGKFTVAALYLNGWQQIQIRKGFSGPAFGTRFVYSPNARFLVNWSTFAGKMGPDSVSRWRFFNNFYSQMNLAKNGILRRVLTSEYKRHQMLRGNGIPGIRLF